MKGKRGDVGRSTPLGATLVDGGVNFSLYSRSASGIDLLLFDRAAWALACAPEAPAQYEGLAPSVPADGLYLDDQGRGVYVVGGKLVPGPRDVLATLGPQAEEMLKKVGDPDVALERLGRVY